MGLWLELGVELGLGLGLELGSDPIRSDVVVWWCSGMVWVVWVAMRYNLILSDSALESSSALSNATSTKPHRGEWSACMRELASTEVSTGPSDAYGLYLCYVV